MEITYCYAKKNNDGSYCIVSSPMNISKSLFIGVVTSVAKELDLIVVILPNSNQK